MTVFFSVKNFEKYQHYKDRSPPWIKLYNDILEDYDFGCLQDASKLHLILIWLLASRTSNKLPYDSGWISARINTSEKVDLEALEKAGFIFKIKGESKVLATCKQNARPEREGESKNNPIVPLKKSRKKKPEVSLEQWESKNGEIKPDQLAKFSQEHQLTPEQTGKLIQTFRGKCAAKDYRYVNFLKAFESWKWGDEIQAIRKTPGGNMQWG